MSTFALIPAAGKSSRMGRPKLALPLGGRTVLEFTIAALHGAGIAEILVVVSPRGAELTVLAAKAGAGVLQLAEETPDMQATVVHGLAWLDDRYHPSPTDSWLLLPADHPTIQPEVIRELFEVQRAQPERSIFIPTYHGKRGHPTLIGWQHTADIRAGPPGQGLNHWLRGKTVAVAEVPVDSPYILADLDTPEDYERLRRSALRLDGNHGNRQEHRGS